MPVQESWPSRWLRWKLNFFPAYRRTGARITAVSNDWMQVHIKLPLNWKTRNYVGSIFGGSIYAAVDPIYMVMLINLLGRDYIVWDKAAEVRFLKPGRSTLRAQFVLEDAELYLIRDTLEKQRTLERSYTIALQDKDGVVCAKVEKLLYFRKKSNASAQR